VPFHLHKAVGLILVAAAARAEDLPPARLWGATNDVLVERAFIPSPQNRHGEVRLVRRGEAHVVQTLLYSTMLRRGLKGIRNKELAAWPAESPHHGDSVRYLELMKDAEARVLEKPGDGADRRARMLIEFISEGDRGFVATYAPEIRGERDHVEISSAEKIGGAVVSPEYVHRAMDLMMESAFKPGPDAASLNHN
jgi:hypothetical protein